MFGSQTSDVMTPFVVAGVVIVSWHANDVVVEPFVPGGLTCSVQAIDDDDVIEEFFSFSVIPFEATSPGESCN